MSVFWVVFLFAPHTGNFCEIPQSKFSPPLFHQKLVHLSGFVHELFSYEDCLRNKGVVHFIDVIVPDFLERFDLSVESLNRFMKMTTFGVAKTTVFDKFFASFGLRRTAIIFRIP